MSVIKNYIYNTIYQLMAIFVPLITMPYLARIFTPSQIGLNAYTFSIANYFMIFGMLGMQMYGNRQVAYVRDNKKLLSKTFWSLFFTQLASNSVVIIIYFVFTSFYIVDNKVIYIVQGLNLLSSVFDISWLFIGLEDFKKVSIRNSLVKLIGVINIFIFIKSSDDLLKYIFLVSIINIVGMMMMWIYVPKYVGKIEIDLKIIKKTMSPLLTLFLPQIAMQIYTLLSRTMIGIMSTTDQVAFYDYAQKIVNMVMAVITSVGTVLMPRVANMTGNGRKKEISHIIEKSFNFVSYIAMPITMGLIAVSNVLVSWFLGTEYLQVGKLIAMNAPIIIAVSFANIIGVQYLIGTKQENKYTISIVVAAIINLCANLFLINKYGAYGAMVSLILAEFIGLIIQLILVRNQLPIFKMLMNSRKYLSVAIIMFVIVKPLEHISQSGVISNVIQGIVGVFVYVGIMFLIKDKIQKEIIAKIIMIIKRK